MRSTLTWLIRQTPWLLTAGLLLALVLGVPSFSRPRYWVWLLSQQHFAVAALALALTPIMLTSGIDLSVGSAAVLGSVVVGVLWRDAGLPIGLALAGGVLAGMLAGLGNGLLVVAGVLPLVATLATRELFRGLAWALSGDTPVRHFPPALRRFWERPVLGVPPGLWALAGLFVLTYLVVHHTWIGRMLYAVGDNEQATRFAGLPVRGLKLELYAWSGLVAGACGVSLVLKNDAAKVDVEQSLELLAIACVVLGGIRITGGGGHVAGTLLGILTVCALQAGSSWVPSTWRDTVSGAVLIVVALANEASARWAAARVSRAELEGG
jgi:ribose/xylose/arabinose/galactoside ABC-type transport system permease subunit